MNRSIIPPYDPQQREPVHPPMVYIEKRLQWEYKQISRNLEKDKALDEAELNVLGEEGWELTGIAQHASMIYYYFKRLKSG